MSHSFENSVRQHFTQLLWAISVAAMFVIAGAALGQNPFEDPFGGAAVAPAPAPGNEAAEEEDAGPDPNDPIVLTVRESNPSTPSELVRAIQTMLDIDRPDEAKRYAGSLLAAKPAPNTAAVLVNEFGSGVFIRMQRSEGMAPEGPELGKLILQGAQQNARDPQRIAGLIEQLQAPSFEIRKLAIQDLRLAGPAAVNPMLKVLQDPARHDEHRAVVGALAQLGTPVVEPLIGVFGSNDAQLKSYAAQALGDLKALRAILYLARPAVDPSENAAFRTAAREALLEIVGRIPTKGEATRYLYDRTQSYLAGTRVMAADADDRVTMWYWNDVARQVQPRKIPADDAALTVAARAATDLYRLAPDRRRNERLYVLSVLEAAKVLGGLDQPLSSETGGARVTVARLGAGTIEDVLTHAMKLGRVPAAIAAVEVLGDIGTPELLASADGQPRTLVQALTHPDLRLKMATARSIGKIDPKAAYPGSSLLTETLGYMAGTVGLPRLLVGHPRIVEARSLAGMLSELGYAPSTVGTGRGLLREAFSSPDFECILVSDAIDGPVVTEVVQSLRKDRRTARTPIGIMAREKRLGAMQRWADLDPLTEAFPRPHDRDAVAFQIGRLLGRAGRNYVPLEERIALGAEAISLLNCFAESPKPYAFYDIRLQQDALITALRVPELSAAAAEVLGRLGTPEAQRALVMRASQNALAPEQREAAAAAFAQAVKQRRLLLTTDEITLQYDRYNQSESLDPKTQQILASILDVIEGKPPAAN